MLIYKKKDEIMKIVTNYHTHTNFTDGSDEPEEIVKKAIKEGFREIGFSDHACYLNDEKTKAYIKTINSLKKKYINKIKIMLGLECEFPVDVFGINLNNYINELDYVIFGNHFTNAYFELYARVSKKMLTTKECNKFYNTKVGIKHRKYACKLYYKNCKYALKCNKLLYFAHPDLFAKYSIDWNKDYTKLTHKLCKLAKKHYLAFEINVKQLNSFKYHPEFWEIVKKYGLDTIVGLDYHNLQRGEFLSELPEVAQKLINEFGFEPLNVKK